MDDEHKPCLASEFGASLGSWQSPFFDDNGWLDHQLSPMTLRSDVVAPEEIIPFLFAQDQYILDDRCNISKPTNYIRSATFDTIYPPSGRSLLFSDNFPSEPFVFDCPINPRVSQETVDPRVLTPGLSPTLSVSPAVCTPPLVTPLSLPSEILPRDYNRAGKHASTITPSHEARSPTTYPSPRSPTNVELPSSTSASSTGCNTMENHSASERQNSPSCATLTPRRRDSPYSITTRHERLPTSLSAPPSAAPASPASSISSLPVPSEAHELGRPFALSSAHWSSSSREGSLSSEDPGVSASPSRFSGEEHVERTATCRLTSHRQPISSQFLLPPNPHSHFAPRMIHPPPPSLSAPPTSNASHEHDPFPRASFERTASAGPSTSRQPRAAFFTRTSSAGPPSACPSRPSTSRPSERRARRPSPYASPDNDPRSLKTKFRTTSPDAEGDEDDDCEVEDEDVDYSPMGSPPPLVSSSTGKRARLPKKPAPKKPALTTKFIDPCSSSQRPTARSRPPTLKIPKLRGNAKKSNAGREEVSVQIVSGKRRYACPINCGSHFSRKNDAYRHLDDRHGAGQEEHICGCGRKLSRRDALHRHYTTCQWAKENRRKGQYYEEEEDGDDTLKIQAKAEEEVNGGDDEGDMVTEEEEEEDELAEDA